MKWNFDRMRDRSRRRSARSEIAPVKDVKVVDPYTVEISSPRPVAPFLLAVLTDRAGMMVSKAAVERFKDDYATRMPWGPGRSGSWSG